MASVKSEARVNLLTLQQSADWLGLKVPTLRDWVWRRKIEFVRVGRAVRIKEETIRAIIAAGTVPAKRVQ